MHAIALGIILLISNGICAQNTPGYDSADYSQVKFSFNADLDNALNDNLVARCKGSNPRVSISSLEVQQINFIQGDEQLDFVRRVFRLELARTKTELIKAKEKNNHLAIEFLSKKIDIVQLEIDSLVSPGANGKEKRYGFFVPCLYMINRKTGSALANITFMLDNGGYLMNSGAIDQVIAEEKLKSK